jgi:ADP-heptose:LPS heptosyltransferase
LRIAGEFFGLLHRLRARKFDLAVDFQGYGETAWLARITGAAQRWSGVHNNYRRWAYTVAGPRVEKMHPAAGYLQLLKHCGLKIGPVQNQFLLPSAALAAAEQFFAQQNFSPGQPVLFIQPFTSSPHKDWPLENFLAVARHFRAQGGGVIFGGGPPDRDRLQPARTDGFPVAAGQPLLVTGGLMKLSRLIIGGDTGVVHLAVAMGNRVIMLMHRVDSGAPTPFGHDDWAVRPLQRGQGTRGITLDRVLTTYQSCLSGKHGF